MNEGAVAWVGTNGRVAGWVSEVAVIRVCERVMKKVVKRVHWQMSE